ncbi:MAG: adenosylmethionine--8-amino-7-oxononanoate transaminase [Nitrospirae bacterium]|nr:adenosylmethionine--8-amino-7-oxononanoate transaminase [Nitrospirota bacterium]
MPDKKEQNSRLADDDKRYLWHPFTQMRDWETDDPLVITRGKGSYLYDALGKKYLDGVSSLWVNVHGHRKKEIDDAVIRQVRTLAHSTFLGLTHPTAIELAKRLVHIAPPGLERVFYSDSGSTAVEIALKMAFQFWRQNGEEGRTKFLSLKEAYHGDTIGSVSVGGMDLFHDIFQPLLFETIKAPAPYCYRCELGLTHPDCGLACAEELGEIMRKNAASLAGMVIEPLVQGAAGMLVQPPGYLRRVRELCDNHGVFMIADEVATGFGRTGTMFACEQEGVTPDFMCLAKGITGGYLPLAATLATDRVYEGFKGEYADFRTFFHGHTYTANPLACAAALANLEVFEGENTLAILKGKIRHLRHELMKVEDLPHVGQVRQKGFMVGIELVQDKNTKEPYPLPEKRGIRVTQEARRRGVIIRPLGNVIVLMPPLSISEGELEKLVEVTHKSIKAATA